MPSWGSSDRDPLAASTLRSLIQTVDAVCAAAYDAHDPLPAFAALDEILTLSKAKPEWDLTTEEGFARAVITVALGMRQAESKVLLAWDARFRRALERNWPELSAADRRQAFADVKGLAVSLGNQITTAEAIVLKTWERDILSAGKVSAIDRYGLGVPPTLTRVDHEAAANTRRNMVNFIRDREGNIHSAYSERAREIVAGGIEQGLGRADISAALRAEYGDMRTPSYWDFCANHFVARDRAIASLTSYQSARIIKYIITAVLDERTTDTCRFLDGQVMDVDVSIEMLGNAHAQAAGDPNLIKEFNPFIQTVATKDGGSELRMRQPGGESVRVATIDRSGVGRVDDKGTYSNAMKAGDMQVRGIGPPPYHQYCRTIIVPETEETVTPVTVEQPVVPEVPAIRPPPVAPSAEDAKGVQAFAETMEFKPGWNSEVGKVPGAPRGDLNKAAAVFEGLQARGEKVVGDLFSKWNTPGANTNEIMSEMASRYQATARRVTGDTAAVHERKARGFEKRMDKKLVQGDPADSTTRPSVADRAALRRTYDAFGPLADKTEAQLLRVEKLIGRAFYRQADGYIKYFGADSLAHEMGHAVETAASTKSTVTIGAKEGFWSRFRDSRKAKGEAARSLAKATGINYEKWEKFVKDKFNGLDPYVSKVYKKDGASEFVSMLSERLLQDPAFLATQYDFRLARMITEQPEILKAFFGWTEAAVAGAR